ncbi:hypothetical protein [Streptomyces justiciae]|uniref:hypothetical protein n=1 Tax=Streptomyces justiciae TaxID=2780140 RepID=UPI002118D344|nr:hypothetical protein [Streptomyces justiciae]MCW8379804.1 hypothetical protein [Streptomyces justiciae]
MLANCTTALAHHPADAGVVHRLGDTLASCTPAWEEWQRRLWEPRFRPPISLEPPEQLRTRLGRQVLPALGAWLAEADAFARIAHAARPGKALSPGTVAPAPAVRPALPPPSPSSHR